jgi:uridine phosphorylase|tara:strand:- start:3301 stop:4074 length:774 start_codon:yes stop_codon:yes gene_type:complete
MAMDTFDWFDPEDESPSVIRPELQDKQGDQLPSNLLVVFAKDVLDGLRRELKLTRSEEKFYFFGGACELYLNQSKNIALIEGAIGAPIGVSAVHTAISRGVRRVFVVGLCGAVDDSLQVGELVIPVECVREEGTSFHYIPGDRLAVPDIEMRQHLEAHLAKSARTYRVGKTVSTDAPYRQTTQTELNWRRNKVIGVDMEMSAVFALCENQSALSVGLFIVSDAHDLTEIVDWEWNRELFRVALKDAIQLMLDFADGY